MLKYIYIKGLEIKNLVNSKQLENLPAELPFFAVL